VQVYALTSTQQLHETLDLFLTRKSAETELREILLDEPDWKDVLRVTPIELDERDVSANQPLPPRRGGSGSLRVTFGRCVFGTGERVFSSARPFACR
jgi:hypothetical protein